MWVAILVQEPTIMRDDQRRAGKGFQRVLQRPQRVHVQIVAWLVQQNHVGAAFKQLGQVDAIALATR